MVVQLRVRGVEHFADRSVLFALQAARVERVAQDGDNESSMLVRDIDERFFADDLIQFYGVDRGDTRGEAEFLFDCAFDARSGAIASARELAGNRRADATFSRRLRTRY